MTGFSIFILFIGASIGVMSLLAPSLEKYGEDAVKRHKFIFLIAKMVFVIIIAASIFYVPKCPAKDIVYKHTSQTITHDVEVRKIRKGKNKEDTYELFVDYDILNMTASQYEELVGTGNNTLTSDKYSLTFCVQQNTKARYVSVKITRYAYLGETDFTKEEIAEFSDIFLDAVNDNLNRDMLQEINGDIDLDISNFYLLKAIFFEDTLAEEYSRLEVKPLWKGAFYDTKSSV